MAQPTCWIGVVARSHVMAGAAGGFVMFAHGKHTAAQRVQPGDVFAYYSPTETLGGADKVRRFTAIGRILPGEPQTTQMTPEVTGWQRRAEYWASAEADIYPLLPQLSFITDPGHWGMYFRKSLFTVAAADFSTIADAMGVGAHFKLGDLS